MAMANGANRLADSVKLYFLTRLSGGRVNHWITVWEQAMFFFLQWQLHKLIKFA